MANPSKYRLPPAELSLHREEVEEEAEEAGEEVMELAQGSNNKPFKCLASKLKCLR